MRRKRIVTVVAVIAVVALLMKGKGLLKQRQEEVASAPTPMTNVVSVPVVKGEEGVMNEEVSFIARVLGDKSIKLSTKLAGYVEEVVVEESQSVKAGELLVKIDETELKSSIDGLRASLAAQKNDAALARRIYERNVKLYRIGGLAKEQLEVSRVSAEMKASLVKNTIQKIAQLEHQRSYLSIRAPFDGVVDAVFLHEGDLAAAGKPILSMSNRKQKLTFSFAPSQKEIETGLIVVSGMKKLGEIRAIYPTSTNGLVTAEVALDAPVDLPIGSSMPIRVVTRSGSGCILPDTTLIHKKEGMFVMVYDNGKFRPKRVSVLMRDANRIMIESCPKSWVASASEVKLSMLPAYGQVRLIKRAEGGSHE